MIETILEAALTFGIRDSQTIMRRVPSSLADPEGSLLWLVENCLSSGNVAAASSTIV